MADHIEGCDGTGCDQTGCSTCEQCLWEFGSPEGLTPWNDITYGDRRLCRLCMGVHGRTDPVQATLYAANATLAELRHRDVVDEVYLEELRAIGGLLNFEQGILTADAYQRFGDACRRLARLLGGVGGARR